MSAPTTVIDVDATTFEQEVVQRSHEVPVVVDFWAEWCGPCRTLGPMLESAVAARNGEVVLAKVDVDANPSIARRFGVQGIPQVSAFRDGEPVTQFTGVVPQRQLDAFLDEVVPSAADRLVAQAIALDGDDARATLRRALELEPDHRDAALALAERLVQEDPQAARELVTPHRPDPAAETIISRASLVGQDAVDVADLRERATSSTADGELLVQLGRALAARQEYDEAMEWLLRAVERGGEPREQAREQLIALFGMLGEGDERVAQSRRRLARALF